MQITFSLYPCAWQRQLKTRFVGPPRCVLERASMKRGIHPKHREDSDLLQYGAGCFVCQAGDRNLSMIRANRTYHVIQMYTATWCLLRRRVKTVHVRYLDRGSPTPLPVRVAPWVREYLEAMKRVQTYTTINGLSGLRSQRLSHAHEHLYRLFSIYVSTYQQTAKKPNACYLHSASCVDALVV